MSKEKDVEEELLRKKIIDALEELKKAIERSLKKHEETRG